MIKQKTKKLFYKNSLQIEFSSEVFQCQKTDNGWQVLLDQTCFYPGGGGQPADKGWLNGIEVLDVKEVDGCIYHLINKKINLKSIKGTIDWHWRRDYMEQHTGQHIISGALWKIKGIQTLSVHLGQEFTTIEIDRPDIKDEEINEVESLANQIVNRNLPVHGIITHSQKIHEYSLRKPCPITGEVRLIQIGNFDCVFCCGLHFPQTGDVSLIKAINMEKIRDHARIYWLIGSRAFHDFNKKIRLSKDLRSIITTDENNFIDHIVSLKEELDSIKKEYNQLENQLAQAISTELISHQEPQSIGSYNFIFWLWKNDENIPIKKIIKLLLKEKNLIFCLFQLKTPKLLWYIGCSEQCTLPIEKTIHELLPIIKGNGGGKMPLFQGMGQNPETIDKFLAEFKKRINGH